MAEPVHVQQHQAPAGASRVETGAVKFGDDWPGLFIRGDEAFHLMHVLRRLADLLKGHPNTDVRDTLRQLTTFADLIDQDVIVRRAVAAWDSARETTDGKPG